MNGESQYLVKSLVKAEGDDGGEAPHPENSVSEVENLPPSLCRVLLRASQPNKKSVQIRFSHITKYTAEYDFLPPVSNHKTRQVVWTRSKFVLAGADSFSSSFYLQLWRLPASQLSVHGGDELAQLHRDFMYPSAVYGHFCQNSGRVTSQRSRRLRRVILGMNAAKKSRRARYTFPGLLQIPDRLQSSGVGAYHVERWDPSLGIFFGVRVSKSPPKVVPRHARMAAITFQTSS